RGSLVVKVTDSWLVFDEFEPTTADLAVQVGDVCQICLELKYPSSGVEVGRGGPAPFDPRTGTGPWITGLRDTNTTAVGVAPRNFELWSRDKDDTLALALRFPRFYTMPNVKIFGPDRFNVHKPIYTAGFLHVSLTCNSKPDHARVQDYNHTSTVVDKLLYEGCSDRCTLLTQVLIMVMDSWLTCHEFEPSTAEDPPSRYSLNMLRLDVLP
ncbi:hypothetical protein TNCV_1173471, partial [Trichonephila clavipes]